MQSMIAELGHYALMLALGLSLISGHDADCRRAQSLGLGLEQVEAQVRVAALEFRQQPGEHVGCQRWDHSKPQAAVKQLTAAVHAIRKVTCGTEDRASASSNFGAGLGEHGDALTAVHQLRSELVFKFADLHGKRGLTYGTFFRRPPEMPMSGECVQVAKLPKGQHANKVYTSAVSLVIRTSYLAIRQNLMLSFCLSLRRVLPADKWLWRRSNDSL